MKVRSIVILLVASFSIIFITAVECDKARKFCLNTHYSEESPKSTAEPIVNFALSELYGIIKVGTPPQSFKCLFDTLSSDTWLYSSDCKTGACSARTKFAYKNSSTFEYEGLPFILNFTSGVNSVGNTVFDSFEINGLKVPRQRFGLIGNNTGFLSTIRDGNLGLGLSSSNSYHPSFLENAFIQGDIDEQIFAFWLKKKTEIILIADAGEVEIGGTNKRRYTGKITYAPLSNQTRWQIKMDRIFVKPRRSNEITVCDDNCQVEFSVGSSAIYGPQDDIDYLNQAIGASFNQSLNSYLLNCNVTVNSLPDVVFNINGKQFPIKPTDYIEAFQYFIDNQIYCRTKFFRTTRGTWVFGGLFIKEYYTIFDAGHKRIGLATSKQ